MSRCSRNHADDVCLSSGSIGKSKSDIALTTYDIQNAFNRTASIKSHSEVRVSAFREYSGGMELPC